MGELGRYLLAYFGLGHSTAARSTRAVGWAALLASWAAALVAATAVCGLLALLLADRAVTLGGLASEGLPFGLGVTVVLVARDLHARWRRGGLGT